MSETTKRIRKILMDLHTIPTKTKGNTPLERVAYAETLIHQEVIRGKQIDGETSDGYHTFNELYEHRVLLWINLVMLQHPKICYLVEEHFEGWFLLGIETKEHGQISYHCPNKYLYLCKNIPRRQPKYDGHTSNDVIKRLERIADLQRQIEETPDEK